MSLAFKAASLVDLAVDLIVLSIFIQIKGSCGIDLSRFFYGKGNFPIVFVCFVCDNLGFLSLE